MTESTKSTDAHLRSTLAEHCRSIRESLTMLESLVNNAEAFKRTDWLLDLRGNADSLECIVTRAANMAIRKVRAS
jgi:hypothetical protein